MRGDNFEGDTLPPSRAKTLFDGGASDVNNFSATRLIFGTLVDFDETHLATPYLSC